VFSIVNPHSFENVYRKWIPELQHHCPDTPILLCGSKIDLRDDPVMIQKLKERKQKPITYEEGEFLAWSCGCIGYVENSSLIHKGLKETFDACIQVVLGLPRGLQWSRKKEQKRARSARPNKCASQLLNLVARPFQYRFIIL
jgi:GTPase SAR1 family protein